MLLRLPSIGKKISSAFDPSTSRKRLPNQDLGCVWLRIYICSCFDQERPQSVWEPGEGGQGTRNFDDNAVPFCRTALQKTLPQHAEVTKNRVAVASKVIKSQESHIGFGHF